MPQVGSTAMAIVRPKCTVQLRDWSQTGFWCRISSLTASLLSMVHCTLVSLSFTRCWCLTCAFTFALHPRSVTSAEKAHPEHRSRPSTCPRDT